MDGEETPRDYDSGSIILKSLENPPITWVTREALEGQVPPLCPKTANPVAGGNLMIGSAPDCSSSAA